MGVKVLVVDDEAKIREIIGLYLEQEQFIVLMATDGHEAVELFDAEQPDVVILDLMLPGIPGEQVCSYMRSRSDVPIIMLTAKTDEDDRVKGLEGGADDYVTKPFSPKELVARVKAILRRSRQWDGSELTSTDQVIRVNQARHETRVNGEMVQLTPTEHRILTLFLSNPGRVFSRTELAEHAFGWDYAGYEETIYVHVKNLRKKLEPFTTKQYISTVYGVGYRWGE